MPPFVNLLLTHLSPSISLAPSLPHRSTFLRLFLPSLYTIILIAALQTTYIRHLPLSQLQTLAPYYLFGLLHPFAPRHLALHLRRLHDSRYLAFHLFPIPLWLLLITLQLSASFRSKHPQLHQKLGRLTILTSLFMLLPLISMWSTGEKWAADVPFMLDWRHPELIISFKSSVWLSMTYWLLCMTRLYLTAIRRAVSLHRFWVYQFVAVGLVPATMRMITVTAVAAVRWADVGKVDPGWVMRVVAGGASFAGLFLNTGAAWAVWAAEEGERTEGRRE